MIIFILFKFSTKLFFATCLLHLTFLKFPNFLNYKFSFSFCLLIKKERLKVVVKQIHENLESSLLQICKIKSIPQEGIDLLRNSYHVFWGTLGTKLQTTGHHGLQSSMGAGDGTQGKLHERVL
jgi:hypothetical protein